MNRLLPITCKEEIPDIYKNTAIELLMEYHNLDRVFDSYDAAQMLIGMCMDNRKRVNIPENFSFIMRSGGANMQYSEFELSFAISIGRLRHIALIGHNHCGMVDLNSRKSEFIHGLMEMAGWDKERAEEHFMYYAPLYEIGSECDFILSETKRLRNWYPLITIAPMLYLVEDNKLYFIKEDEYKKSH